MLGIIHNTIAQTLCLSHLINRSTVRKQRHNLYEDALRHQSVQNQASLNHFNTSGRMRDPLTRLGYKNGITNPC